MSERITNKCYASFHYYRTADGNIDALVQFKYTFNFVFQSLSKFIRKTQRLDHQNISRNIICSPDEIIAVNGING